MRAEHPHPKTQINFVIQYTEKSGTSSVVSHAGVNTVQTTWGSFWSKAYAAVKDLALPIVLALLAFWLTSLPTAVIEDFLSKIARRHCAQKHGIKCFRQS